MNCLESAAIAPDRNKQLETKLKTDKSFISIDEAGDTTRTGKIST